MIGVGGLLTVGMVLCAFAVNQPQIQQVFSVIAFVVALIFIVTASLSVNEENTPERKRFLAFGFLIGITLFCGAVSAFRLSKLEDFDATATDK